MPVIVSKLNSAHLCTSECVSRTKWATPRVSSTRKALGQNVMALPSSRGASSLSSTTTGMPTCAIHPSWSAGILHHAVLHKPWVSAWRRCCVARLQTLQLKMPVLQGNRAVCIFCFAVQD